jgi:hypothetical protein
MPLVRRQLRTRTGLLAMSLLSACLPMHSVWIDPGSTADMLILRASTRTGYSQPVALDMIRIDNCTTQQLYWLLSNPARTLVNHVIYGQPPEGWKQHTEATPLEPGCYRVLGVDFYEFGFLIDSLGAVTEVDDATTDRFRR